MRDKIRGMFLGTAIGDGLGMPVETWTPDRIKDRFPDGIRRYESPDGHKWFSGHPVGSWTDDTLFTLATSRALVESGTFDLDSLARAQIWAYQEAMKSHNGPIGGSGVPGWGYTTACAIRNLVNNVPWQESGKTSNPNMGHGNGVVMKLAPIAAWSVTDSYYKNHWEIDRKIIEFSSMTHYTKKSAIASIVHVNVLVNCLLKTSENYDIEKDLHYVIDDIYRRCWDEEFDVSHLNGDSDEMFCQLKKVFSLCEQDDVRVEFGGGSCNVSNSLPFTYAYWIKDHKSVQLLYDLVESGGDTDSNASIAGGMLGALHGAKIFPNHLIEGLNRADDILKAADEFCDRFNFV